MKTNSGISSSKLPLCVWNITPLASSPSSSAWRVRHTPPERVYRDHARASLPGPSLVSSCGDRRTQSTCQRFQNDVWSACPVPTGIGASNATNRQTVPLRNATPSPPSHLESLFPHSAGQKMTSAAVSAGNPQQLETLLAAFTNPDNEARRRAEAAGKT